MLRQYPPTEKSAKMGYKMVYRSLTELFPQIDPRILKAVAFEHPKDADQAAAVVISEIVPSLTQPGNKTFENMSDNKVESYMQNGTLTGSVTDASSSGTIPLDLDSDRETRAPVTESHSNSTQLTNVMPNGDLDIQNKVVTGLVEPGVVSSDPPSAFSEDPVHELIDSKAADKLSQVRIGDQSLDDVKEASGGSVGGENSDAELSGSNLLDETSKGSLTVENGDQELGGVFSSTLSRSTQGCNIDHLELIIEDAKSNKKTLFTVMESIMNLMRDVEHQEKEAEKMKEESIRGGFDTLKKVEELKKILAHAKEANDMDAGEVYGERSILTTEVHELENRLLNLSEERDKSLCVLDEMREVLEMRLTAALEIKSAAELERQGREASARKALAEQEAIMEKVVQESKLLQQEAEENSKLREFLMDRGRIVDSLQGEISVICQDIRLLKEKFDNRVPLSQSITSSQTSCKLASSISSMKSLTLERPLEPSSETPDPASGNNSNKSSSPKASVNEAKDKGKEVMDEDDGWDIFDKETEL